MLATVASNPGRHAWTGPEVAGAASATAAQFKADNGMLLVD